MSPEEMKRDLTEENQTQNNIRQCHLDIFWAYLLQRCFLFLIPLLALRM